MPKYVVRCGTMRTLGVCTTSRGGTYQRTAQVIARTDRGLEAGEVLCEAGEQVFTQLKQPPKGQILREMTADDRNELRRLHEQERDEFETCKRYIADMGLPMQLVDAEHIFGGERVIFYYLAEERVDFRELVRSLAGEFQTRIEMRQIGVRADTFPHG